MSQTSRGYSIAIIGIAVWSTTPIFIGYLISHYGMPALLLSLWRNILVFAALAPLLLIVKRPLLRIDKSQIRFFMFYGLTLALFNSIWTVSVVANGAAVATVLAYSSAGFTAIFAWWFFREKLGLPKIVAVTLSLVGCVLVSNAYSPEMWNMNLLGILTGLFSGIFFACYNLLGKETAKRRMNPWTSVLYSFLFASLFTLIFNLFPTLPGAAGSLQAVLPDLPLDGWLILIFVSCVPTLLGFGLYNTSMNYLPASNVSLLATLEPAMTTVLAYIFLNERMSAVQLVGAVVILVAVLIMGLEKNEGSETLRQIS
ncbi:MAG: hypothetical protein UZ15_CFX003003364 [Chloroflexi bacterium OLB15]|nr:MAG: hypothetical protein UZ15_CFX003003364 [Chloroflexi bacterium OLB15]